MGTNSAGRVGSGNDGQTDMGRGSTIRFSYSKSGRKTGFVSRSKATISNAVEPDANKRTVSDPRLV